MCGEKARCIRCMIQPKGSPPRVRGEEDQKIKSYHHHRITPACAGRRVVGAASSKGGMGSPPRARGEARERFSGFSRTRITPACAGRSHWAERKRDAE